MKEGFIPGDRSPGGTDDTMAVEVGLEGFNLDDLRPFEPIELKQAGTPKSLLLNQYHDVLQRGVKRGVQTLTKSLTECMSLNGTIPHNFTMK